MIKAERDLRSARQLAGAVDPLLDTAAYHCQQAAEKSLKGYLTFHDIRFDKTHDIEQLLYQASRIDPEFSAFDAAAELLTPLATEFRYPGEALEPEMDEFKEAFAAADLLVSFVLKRLPPAAWP